MANSGLLQTPPELVNPGDTGIIKLTEFKVFKTIMSNENKFKRVPNYGDYTILHPVHRPLKPLVMRSIAKH